MTFEDEVRKEDEEIFALFMKHGVPTGDGEICRALAVRFVEERQAWRAVAGGAPLQMLDACKYLSARNLL